MSAFKCPECGNETFRAEEHGWWIRGCKLTPEGDFDSYTDEGEFTADDGGDVYVCDDCGTAV